MPIYEYHCLKCATDFEEFIRSSNDEDRLVCPQCSSSELERQFSVFGTKTSEGFVSSASKGASCSGCSSHSCSSCH